MERTEKQKNLCGRRKLRCEAWKRVRKIIDIRMTKGESTTGQKNRENGKQQSSIEGKIKKKPLAYGM
jgi:hypothetical protein